MKKLTQWFSDLRAGKLMTPQEIFRASLQERDADDTSFQRFIGAYGDGEYFAPVARLARPSHFHTQGWINQSERADWQHCHEGLTILAAKSVVHFRKAEIPMFIHAAWRSKEVQDAARARGASSNSYPFAAHCQGKAFDIVHSVYAWDMTPMEWLFVGKVVKDIHRKMMKELKPELRWELEWGGDWFRGRPRRNEYEVGWDPAHFEVKGWRKQAIWEHKAGAPRHATPERILTLQREGYINAGSK